MVNTKKLNEAIAAKGYRKEYLAGLLGISRQSLSNKITGKTEFRAEESRVLKETLELTDRAFVDIFFTTRCGSEPQTMEA